MATDLENGKTGDLASGDVQAGHSCRAEVGRRRAALKWALVLLPFGYLWFRLINNLRLEWATNPQYSYGWVVPVLCVGLLVRRWEKLKAESREQKSGNDQKADAEDRDRPISTFNFQLSTFDRRLVVLLFTMLAFLYLPTRLVEGATPEWRPIQWSLGFVAIGLTLCTIYLGRGRGWLMQLVFPVSFLAVAIPWPTLFEEPIIQGLTRWNAATVIEVMGILGVPALQHGNVIEVGTGVVGIDEACSGIRSFQSSIMISLFLGEFFCLSRFRRVLLVLIGFILAFAFNVCRTSLLTWVAAKKGVAAIAQYHDPAGLAILLACTAGMWAVAWILTRSSKSKVQNPKSEGQSPESGVQQSETRNAHASRRSQTEAEHAIRNTQYGSWSLVRPLALGLLTWLVVVEIGVQAWYRSREAHFTPSPKWSLVFPESNSTFKAIPVGEKSEYLLRFDEGKQGEWQETDGSHWQAFYFNWLPGRVAGYLAKRHTPEICMPASGRDMSSGPELMMVKINGIELPIRHYVFGGPGNALQVFHCRWEDGMDKDAYVQHESARFNLVRGIWAGRGVHGQKVLEFIISGCEDSDQAKAALVRQLERLIKVDH